MRGFKVINEGGVMPERGTKASAGYDFFLTEDLVIEPGGIVKTDTGVAAFMQPGEHLKLYIRSSAGIKKHLRLTNTVGIIDSDFYPNTIQCSLHNFGKDTIKLSKGDRVVQGIFHNHLVASDEAIPERERSGGIGSTDMVYQ